MISDFLQEIQRRNVVRVAVVYLIAGWLTMQVVDVMLPALQLPEWLTSAVAAFVIIGFPFALIFAWAFEMTPEGIKREKDIDRDESITPQTGSKLNRAAVKAYENRYGWGNSYQLAEIFADAGDLDSTFLWLGRAAEVKDPGGPWALIMPFFDKAKEDPRWADYRALFNL